MFASLLVLFFSTNPIAAISEECATEWGYIYSSQTTPGIPFEYFLMYQYSGFAINDLGNYDSCNKIDRARFVLFVYSGSSVQTVCGPKSCTELDYYTTPFPFYRAPGFLVFFPHLYEEQNYKHYDDGASCMLAFMIFMSVIIVLSTIADYFATGEKRKEYFFQYFLCFSLINNVNKLLTTRSQDRLGKSDTLEILNAVRVFSIGWVIMGHVLLNYIGLPLVNWYDFSKDFRLSQYTLMYAAFFAVDTFFWLSGLLMTYLFIIEFEKTPGIPAFKMLMVYIHRFLRITPVYMFCLLFWWSMEPFLGNGPLWVAVTERFNDDCHKYWYSNLLFINNFIPHWESSDCLGQSWYLANDMQFFIISPIILIIYIKFSKEFGWLMVVGLNITGIVCGGTLAAFYNLNPSILSSDNGTNYSDYYYRKPYCRIPPYITGMACGMILFSYRQFKEKEKVYDKIALFFGKSLDNVYVRYATFGIGMVIINILVFLPMDTYRNPGDEGKYHHWNNSQKWAFIALERFFWGVGISMILMPMLLGYMVPVAKFMSAYIWSVMARMSFVMYLMHYGIIETALNSTKSSIEFDFYNNTRDTFYFFFLSFVFSVPVVLAIEMPFGNLERHLLSFMRKKPNDESTNVSLRSINDTGEDKKKNFL